MTTLLIVVAIIAAWGLFGAIRTDSLDRSLIFGLFILLATAGWLFNAPFMIALMIICGVYYGFAVDY